MKRFPAPSTVLIASCLALAAASSFAEDALQALKPAVPTSKWASSWWMKRFETVKSLAATGRYDIAFVGDSITHHWETGGRTVWAKYFASGRYRALNAGFGGDRTEHVLWRLDHDQFGGTHPKAIVLMIGTNNTGHFGGKGAPIDAILGIREILDRLGKSEPQAKVVLLPVFPRGATAEDPLRRQNDVINKEIVKFADGRRVIWLDFTDKFTTPDGRLLREFIPDLLHPRAPAYEIWANELLPVLDGILSGVEPVAGRYARVNPAVLSDAASDAAVPLSRITEAWWRDRIRANRNAIARSGGVIDAVFLGDSITHYWDEGEGLDTSKEITDLRKTYSILNCGYGGDDTRHLLWRLKYGGELDGFKTKFVMLMIGTNNAKSHFPDETAEGVRAIIDLIREKQPEARILHMATFPAGKVPAESWIWERNAVLNGILRLYDRDRYGTDRITFLDINDKFMRPNGELKAELFDYEYLHPVDGGYTIWRQAIEPYLKSWVGR